MANKDVIPVIQSNFTAGEVSPELLGRTDLARYKNGVIAARNFCVNPKGGLYSRAGTQQITTLPGPTRMIPFQFAEDVTTQNYILLLSDYEMRIAKNSGDYAYPNSGDVGLLESGGFPIVLTTPWPESELFRVKFSQINDQVVLTRRGYQRQVLSRVSDTSWTLVAMGWDTPALDPPSIASTSVSALPSGSTDPQTTRYIYAVSAVDADENESLLSAPAITAAGINIAATQGSVTVTWNPVADAVYYKVYKGLPGIGDFLPLRWQSFGFVAYAYGTQFVDTNVVPDYTRGPLRAANPFGPGMIVGYTITAGGSGYDPETCTLTVTDANGTGAILYPVISTNKVGETGSIVGIYIADPGIGYVGPTVTASGGSGFAATLELSPTTGITPDVVELFQQRRMYASTETHPNGLFASRTGTLEDFRKTNPTVEDDAFSRDLFGSQIAVIRWLLASTGGLLVGTNSHVVQLTAPGSSVANPQAITLQSAVAIPQTQHGVADIRPLEIENSILYVEANEASIREMTLNAFVNVFASKDVLTASDHLLRGRRIVSWDFEETPNKVIWVVQSDGRMIGVTYFKAEEVLGPTRFETQGAVRDVLCMTEGGRSVLYLVVERGTVWFLERMAGNVVRQDVDAWALDCAISVAPQFYPNVGLRVFGDLVGATSATFVAGDIGKQLRAGVGLGLISEVIDPVTVRVIIERPFDPDPENGWPYLHEPGTWYILPLVSSVSGLDALNGSSVYAQVDGKLQGPFTISGGSITLTTPGYHVIVGKLFSAEMQTLPIDIEGATTIQGAPKKFTAVSLRVYNAGEFVIGNSAADAGPVIGSTDFELMPAAPGLVSGDERRILNQWVNTAGQFYVKTAGYPISVLAVIGDLAL